MAADLPTLIRSHGRWRFIFLALGLALPLLLHTLFERQIHRLEALADHGQEATATVTSVSSLGSGSSFTHYTYSVDGVSYTWNVSQAEAPYRPGTTFPITYLPEDPSLNRPGPPPSSAAAEAASNEDFTGKLVLGIFAFFLVFAGMCQLKLKALRARAATGALLPSGGTVVSPVWLGRAVALLLLGVMLGVNFDPKVHAVHVKAFGVAPLGIPVTAFVCLCTVVLFAPYFRVFEHLMRIVVQAREDGSSLSKIGILAYLLRVGGLHPELARSRNVVLAGFAFFVVLVGAWIAYADRLGI